MPVVPVEALGPGEVRRLAYRYVVGSDDHVYRQRRDGTYRLPDGVQIATAGELWDETPLWLEPVLFIRDQWRKARRWLTRA